MGTIPDRCAYWGCALLIQASTTPVAQSTKQCSAPAHPIHFVKFRTAIQVLVAIPNSCFPFISSYHSLLILTVACLSPILCILCSKWWANSSLVHSCQPAFQQPPAAPSSKAPDDFGGAIYSAKPCNEAALEKSQSLQLGRPKTWRKRQGVDAESNRIHPMFFTINGLYKAWTYGWFMSDLLILLGLVDIYMVYSLCIGWYLIGCGYVYFIFDIFEQWSCHVARMEAHLEDDEAQKVDAVVESWRDETGRDESWCWKIPKSPMKHLIETMV